jgi:hypothetical protein
MPPFRRHHALTLTWNGERGSESTSTASCRCGWEESASNQEECRFEYRQHMITVRAEK